MATPQWMKTQCEQHVNQPVQLQMNGQQEYQGVIEHVDDHYVYLLVPTDEQGQYMDVKETWMEWNHQQWGNAQDGYDQRNIDHRYYPYYPYNPYYYPYYRPRPVWNRLVLPLALLTAFAVL
ncbi:hypothetical protein [Halalkalibacter sp. APA_J-10(15)]|uniref:hypothetical protein n=1 Tax=unclassified Halalkalibacter TaxID=2893063 RepID=UPI001FF4ED88|nr:hypothetical protein [Halalkalibacter sp. APA_J-10(15)]MCK0473961.1 hypothetical protein [Halalkalibacter sp. APA_J-10(15)]